MNRRVIYQGDKATVRYEGPLKHEDKGDEVWVGVEWDDPTRGRHNGTVKEYTYFVTQSNIETSGSLLRKSKVSFGYKLLEAIFMKYFKEIPAELEEIIQEDAKIITNINMKQIKIEFDSAAFFETIKKRKKMVEFYGFDEIWKKINNLQEIQELSLESQMVSSIGADGWMGSMFKNLSNLSLENNLLYSWHQVFLMGSQLKNLRVLSISGNRLQKLEEFQQQMQQQQNDIDILDPNYKIYDYEQGQHIDTPVMDSCNHIEVLVIINMKLTWKDICQVLPAFRGVNELMVCKNALTDYENIKYSDKELQKLRLLNMEQCEIGNFAAIQEAFGDLPAIEKLVLNRNNLEYLCHITKFQKVTHIAIDHNLFNQPIFLNQLSSMPLTTVSMKHNPIQDRLGKLYSRQRAIAEIPTLQVLNGSDITKFERKDSEIFYLKSGFEEYFLLRHVKHYYYDYEDFVKFAEQHHPRVILLIKKFGNPYEIDPTVKGEFNKPKQAIQQNVQCCVLKIIDRAGKIQGKPIDKKFQLITGIFPVRQVVSKLTNLPLKNVQVSIQVTDDSDIVLMDGQNVTLNDYGAQDGSKIYVDLIQQ